MNYEIIYMFKNEQKEVSLCRCENIMDATYKFYEAFGIECEIISINKLL